MIYDRDQREALKDRLAMLPDDDLFEIVSSVVDVADDDLNAMIEQLIEDLKDRPPL